MSKITFSQAMQGYLLAIGARHLSEHTVKDYVNTFNKFTAFLGDDVPIEDITHKEIEAFFTAQSSQKVFRLSPGESWEYAAVWKMIDDNGTLGPEDDFPVGPGKYKVTGELLGEKVFVLIEIK